MARIASHHQCVLCKQMLSYPDNCQMLDYIILVIQFYQSHNLCEQNKNLVAEFERKLEEERKKKEKEEKRTKKKSKSRK